MRGKSCRVDVLGCVRGCIQGGDTELSYWGYLRIMEKIMETTIIHV